MKTDMTCTLKFNPTFNQIKNPNLVKLPMTVELKSFHLFDGENYAVRFNDDVEMMVPKAIFQTLYLPPNTGEFNTLEELNNKIQEFANND